MKFYSRDPLATFLIDKLHMTPIKLAIFWTTLVLSIGFFTALLSDTLVSRPDQIGFFQDWVFWIASVFLTPVLAGYYLWGADAIENLLQGLKHSEVVDISDEDITLANDMYQNHWRVIISVLLAAAVGVIYFSTRANYSGFSSNAMAPRVGITIVYTLDTYAMSMLILALIINVGILLKILPGKEFRINPLHPDRCGGLKVLSAYSIKTVYLVALFGIIVGIIEYRSFVTGVSQQYWQIHLIVPFYLIIASVAFFAPLGSAHTGMSQAKKNLLNDIAAQFWRDYRLVLDELSDAAGVLEEEISKIQQLRTIYEITDKFPVWPFDVNTLRKFLVSLTAPLLPVFIGLLSQLLTKLFTP